jgi:hypothetical protein
MKYLKNFSLYEAKSKPVDPNVNLIKDAMANTSAGKDLAAVAKSYTVSSNARLVLNGLRGKTYVKEDPTGARWVHWVEATGRSYAHGAAPTLEACLRDCWKEFVLNSTTFRPNGMKVREYLGKIEPVLSSFEGKALNVADLQFEMIKILKDKTNWNPIRDPDFIFDRPDLQDVFDFIGFKKKSEYFQYGGFKTVVLELLGNESPLAQILPWDNDYTRNEIEIRVDATPEDEYHYWDWFSVGGDLSKRQEYKDRFIPDLIALLNLPEFRTGKPAIQKILAGKMLGAALNGDSTDVVDLLDDYMNDASKLAELPEPLRSQVMQKKGYNDDEIQGIYTSKKLGLI